MYFTRWNLMDTTPATAQEGKVDEDEWELQNDDGFVYKCRKRRRCAGDNSAAAGRVIAVGNPKAEKRNQRERKRRTLEKLKKRYQREMDLWEILSKASQDMKVKAGRWPGQRWKEERANETASFLVSASVVARETKKDGIGDELLIDELFLLAEIREEVIRKISSWSDIAEAVCKAETEWVKQLCFDLPIWGEPCELMASLCSL